MRIVCISDTHTREPDIPMGDLLIHSGDATFAGNPEQIKTFSDWFCALSHKNKVFVPGNHDFGFEGHLIPGSLLPGVEVLINRCIHIEGLCIYGSPYVNKYGDWAFMKPLDVQLAEMWNDPMTGIPPDCDILVTHGPPYGILDISNSQNKSVGSPSLYTKVMEIKPKLHVFGHIHEGYGQREINGIKFVNASSCNREYKCVNAPIVIDI